jgi:predicted RNA-binding protein YlxR (DUF448 family)
MGRTGSAPLRTCVGCRALEPKPNLLRLVAGADGVARLDPTGRAPGRGAYVHARPECVRSSIRRGGVARALRVRAEAGWAASLVDELGSVIPAMEGLH